MPSASAADAKEKDKSAASKLGRINPFASFFGNTTAPSSDVATPTSIVSASPSKADIEAHTPDRALSPVGDLASSYTPGSPKPSVLSADMETASIRSGGAHSYHEGYQVAAYTISKPIRASEVNKAVHKALRATIRDELSRMPEKVVEKVFKLVTAGAYPTYVSSSDTKSDPSPLAHVDFSDPTSTGEDLQGFMEGIYDDLVPHFRANSSHIFAESSDTGSMIRRKASWTRRASGVEKMSHEADEEGEKARKVKKERLRQERNEMVEKQASEGTERVEGLVCRLLYNRYVSVARCC